MRAPFVTSIGLMLAAVCSVTTSGQQDEKVVPVHQEPRHRLMLEPPESKILDVQIRPGDLTLFHTHSHPILYVTMSTSQTRSQSLGGDWGKEGAPTPATTLPDIAAVAVAPSMPPGRVMTTTSYAKQPLTHRVYNGGKTLFRLIATTNESAGDPSTAPSEDFPATSAKPEVDNQWFRTYRWTLDAPTSEHRHRNPVNIVLVHGQAAVKGAAPKALQQLGTFAWIPANTPHTIEGVGGGAQVVEIEVRKPR